MFIKMLLSRPAMLACLAGAAGMLLSFEGHRAHAQGPMPMDVAWDMEDGDAEHVLRGPMHEAFAAPVPFDPEPGLVVPVEPPAPIDEMPPDIQPEADAMWLEGYWGWDPERENFLWISGVYRVPPPGRRWVPGHWQEVDEGYQWNPGFWAPLEDEQLAYLPDPPETLERGPTSPAPSDEHFWANGHWYYGGARYVWRPGYWARGHEQWVWVPAHYVWTPRGVIFVRGYWDYRLIDRGICFAPVYWRRPVYLRAGFYYRPVRVIDLVQLHLHMFVRPRYHHYYYGDWYGVPRWGIHASFAFHGRYGYDPLWTYHSWYFGRRGIDYGSRVRGWHRYFGHYEDRRPPRTWRSQQQFAERHRDYAHLRRVSLGHDMKDFASRHPGRVTRVGEQERERMRDTSRAMRELRDMRSRSERDRRPGSVRLPDTADVRHLRERISRDPADRRPPDARRPERPEVRRPERPDVRRPERPEVRRPERPEVRRPERPEVRRPERPEVRRPERPEVQRPERPEVRRPERPEVRRPERPEVRRPERPEVRRPERPEVQRPERPEVRRPERPEVRRSERPEVRRTERPEVRRPERGRQAGGDRGSGRLSEGRSRGRSR